jgi:SulP family sulfate permease
MSADAETAETASSPLVAPIVASAGRQVDVKPRARGAIVGGLTLAIVSFSVAAPVGTLAVAPLGSGYTGLGVVIGLTAAIFGGLVASIAGKAPELKTGPITATAVLWSAALAQVLATTGARDEESVSRALVQTCLAVVLTGALQLAMGVLRLGSAIKFVPYPVVAGFRNGIAVLILVSQAPVLLGKDVSLASIASLRLFTSIEPVNLVVGAFVAAGILALRHTRLAVLGPFIAIVASIFALLAAKVVDQATHRRHDGNRELIAQGFGNIAAGGFGGIPVSGLPSQSLIAWRAGAGGRAATLIACLVQLAVLEFAGHWIEYLPAAALAGVMVVTGLDLLDHWSMRLFGNLRREDTHRPTIAAELAIVVLVTALIIAGYLVTAVVLGIVISAIAFISRMSRKVVRHRSTGRSRRSRRRRAETIMQRLREVGDRVVVFELDGPLFFGTADRLVSDVEAHAASAPFVILDFRRVNAIDATGARILQQIAETLDRRGARLLFSAIAPHDPNRHLLRDMIPSSATRPSWFADVDHALEWCEDRLLEETQGGESAVAELPLSRVDLCAGLDAGEIAVFERAMTRREHAKGSALFRRGEPGDELFVLLMGSVSLSIRTGDAASARRLLTLHAGVTFGEMALLEGKPRSADALFDSHSVTVALSRGAFDRLTREHPQLANKLLLTLARILSAHLRATTDELRELER